jgi:hypothetical protein
MVAAQLPTLWDLSQRINRILTHDQFPDHLLGDFIDDFRLRAKSREEKMGMVQDEPESRGWDRHRDIRAYLAAVTETLCREAGLPPPDWTQRPDYFLKEPWFAGHLENLKAILLVESPIPFRRRNLFVSANALSRV